MVFKWELIYCGVYCDILCHVIIDQSENVSVFSWSINLIKTKKNSKHLIFLGMNHNFSFFSEVLEWIDCTEITSSHTLILKFIGDIEAILLGSVNQTMLY